MLLHSQENAGIYFVDNNNYRDESEEDTEYKGIWNLLHAQEGP